MLDIDIVPSWETRNLERATSRRPATPARSSWRTAPGSRRQRAHAATSPFARHARKVAEPCPEPGEFVDVVLMEMPRFREDLRTGELTDVDLGYLALDHLGLFPP